MRLPSDGSLAVCILCLCYDGANCYDEMTEMSSHPDAERERYVATVVVLEAARTMM